MICIRKSKGIIGCAAALALVFLSATALYAQPYDKEFYHQRAQQYLLQGNLSGALEVYNLLVGADPNDARAFNGRGKVFERRAELNSAMADYEHALELNPTYAEAEHNRTALLQKYKDERPPSVEFAPQGAMYNNYIFNPEQSAREGRGGQVYYSQNEGAYPIYTEDWYDGSPGSFGDYARDEYESNPLRARPTESAAAQQPVKPARFPQPPSAAKQAADENWKPVPQQETLYLNERPLVYPDERPVIPPQKNVVAGPPPRVNTGFGDGGVTDYLSPSQYQQPATSARVDGSLAARGEAAPRASSSVPTRVESSVPVRITQSRPPEAPVNTGAVGKRAPASAITYAPNAPAPQQTAPAYTPQTKSTAQTRSTAPAKSAASVTQAYPGNVGVTRAQQVDSSSAQQSAAPTGTSASVRLAPLVASPNPPAGGPNVSPASAHGHNNAGLVFYNGGNFELAVTEFTQAITMQPDLTAAYNNRGAAYTQLGKFELALADFNQALRLNPYYFDAQYNREILRPFVK